MEAHQRMGERKPIPIGAPVTKRVSVLRVEPVDPRMCSG